MLISLNLKERKGQNTFSDQPARQGSYVIKVCEHFLLFHISLFKWMIFNLELARQTVNRPGISSLRGQGHFHLAKATSIWKSKSVGSFWTMGNQGQYLGQKRQHGLCVILGLSRGETFKKVFSVQLHTLLGKCIHTVSPIRCCRCNNSCLCLVLPSCQSSGNMAFL